MPSPTHTVRPLPDPLVRLSAYALDLHWSWSHAGDAVWTRLDEQLWERTQNPWLLLQYVPRERLERLATDADLEQKFRTLSAGMDPKRQDEIIAAVWEFESLADVALFARGLRTSPILTPLEQTSRPSPARGGADS